MGKLSEHIRKKVAFRAAYACEYCRVKEIYSFLPFQVDHIISIKHGGGDELANLAYACPHCNQHKGTDLGTLIDSAEGLVPLYNPRIDSWDKHFDIDAGEIIPLSATGTATVKLLRFNDPERLIQRKLLLQSGVYP